MGLGFGFARVKIIILVSFIMLMVMWPGMALGAQPSDISVLTAISFNNNEKYQLVCTVAESEEPVGRGSISGQVRDNNGSPIAGASVFAVLVNGGYGGSANTDGDGNYTITGLVSGEYRVEVRAISWIRQEHASNVSITAPNTTSNINFTMEPGGSISGRTVDEKGYPIADAVVYADLVGGGFGGSGHTNADGNYTITGLASGEYRVEAQAIGWIRQQHASNISVTAPNTISNINFTMKQGGSISGKIVDEQGNLIANARVSAIPGSGGYGGYAITNIGGNYTITGLASGEYRFEVQANGYIRQQYAGNLNVTAPDTMSNINFTMQYGGSISGRIADERGKPIANADVFANLVSGGYRGYASTNTGGNYTITGLASGEYRVEAQANGYIRQQYASNVSVTAPNTISNINFTMQPGGSISGKIVDEQGKPLVNAIIYAGPVSGGFGGYASTNIGGNYIITGLASGEYRVEVQANGWIRQEYASDVSVTASNTTSNINFTMQPGGSISGRIFKKQGISLENISVQIATPNNEHNIDLAGISATVNLQIKEPADTDNKVINIAAITGVAIPVRDGNPVTEIIETEQYTGTVSWLPEIIDKFTADAVYTAIITINPKPGYVLTGVPADFFTVEGADSVTNRADSGEIIAIFYPADA